MKTNSTSSKARYYRLYKDLLITFTICIIDFIPRKRRATLNTLKILNTLIAFKAPNAPPLWKMTSIKLRITIVPSMKFILSAAHFAGPSAVIFKPISTAKPNVKKVLADVQKFTILYDAP